MKNSIFNRILFSLLALCTGTGLFGQMISVNGLVTEDNGEPLYGVNILVKSSGDGTITDFDGKFELKNIAVNDTLVFSYLGFDTQNVPVNGRSLIDVMMSSSSELLDEVVVVGYGIQRKSDVTGAITRVKSEEIQKIPTTSVDQALQGKVAGVQVTPSSGEPGANAVVRIRGVGTLNTASPIYVVDGVILDDIGFLNMNDVESIDVLKDASATAIYGSRGANGVIIVSTKKGKANSETRFQFSTYYGVQDVVKKIDLVNGTDFAILANETAVNEGVSPLYDNPEQYGEGTDWQDVIFQRAPIQSYQLSASGGSDKLIFNLSGNYIRQNGIIRQSEFDRFTFRMNNEYLLTDNVRFGHNLSFMLSGNVRDPGVLGNAYRAYPIYSPRDSSGNLSDTAPVGNPEAQFEFNNNNEKKQRLSGNVYATIDFLKNFTFKSSLGVDLVYLNSRRFTPEFYVSPSQQNPENQISIGTYRGKNIVWDNTVTFSKSYKHSNLSVMGGVSMQEFYGESLGGSRKNIPGDTEEFFYLDAGPQDFQTNYNGASSWGLFSYLARVNYSLNDRYLATVNYRVDGSSKFGANNRYGHFPSFSLGWIASNEAFFPTSEMFSRLKFRAGYGAIGNDKTDIFGLYPSQATVSAGQDAVFGTGEVLNYGATLLALANPDLKWEASRQFNAGVEAGFFANRLTTEVDFYNKVTSGVLIRVDIPQYVGAEEPPVLNAADVLNRGFDISVNWRETGIFSYNFGVVASTVYNEVLSLGEGKEFLLGGDLGVGGKRITRTIPGLPIGAFYGYEIEGIFQNQQEIENSPTIGDEKPGDFKFRDLNGDGVITADGDKAYLGSSIPDFIFGFSMGASYKGLDFSIDFNGQTGNMVANAKKAARFGTYNYEVSYLDRWTGEGTSNTEPRVTNGGHNYLESEWFLEDASYIKLRNVQLGYTLPEALIQKLRFKKIRFYVSGTNLMTWSKYSGYTPEIVSESVLSNGVDQGVFPLAKTYTFGISADF